MPHYFVDFQDQRGFYKDEEGSEMADAVQARAAAISSLLHVFRMDQRRDDEHHETTVTVRDEQGSELYRATLTFQGQKLDRPPS